MNLPLEPPAAGARRISRRRALRQAAGGLAASLLAALGLSGGRGEASLVRVVSLRAVLRQISPDCDPAHGIRLILPDDGGVTSLNDIIRRFYRG
jgi:hypothetical protein